MSITLQNPDYKLLKVIPVTNEHENKDEASKVFYKQNCGVDADGTIIAFVTGAGDELQDLNGDLYLVVNNKHIYGTIA